MPRVRTVVVANDTCNVVGGAAKVAIDNALSLAQGGLRVIFFCAAGTPDSRLLAAGVEVINLNSGLFFDDSRRASAAWRGLSSGRTYSEFRRVLESLDDTSTVVHVHSWTKGLSSSIFKACSLYRFPVFVTVHDYFLACPNGGFYNYPSGQICSLTPLSMRCLISNCDRRSYAEKIYRSVRLLVQDRNISSVEKLHLVYISHYSSNIIASNIRQPHVAEFCPNPILVPPEAVKDPNLYDPKYDLLFVGRVDAEKGITLFCDAAKRTGLRAAVVGDGELLGDLTRQYPSIDFLGWRSLEDLSQIGTRSRVLVIPSQWYEVSPLTVYEMQAMTGIPALVVSTCAASEQIIPGTNGYVYEPGSAEDTAAKLLTRLVDLGGLDRHQIQRLALEHAYRVSNSAERLVKIYDSSLSR